ncbi:DsbA family protein [Agrobacterium vitis]|uniref:DsbA family protein n=1 Tax=Agrobacterium vitis TaxID=373 RepID=A0A368NVZ3_AGRVI|nr:DsbA family protein [Agrobacterium vitis]KAA3513600.1 DsbA family protein [Agrobacterium vitis]KAA3528181.1 DsbA family protein [Agrobacterium vitis]MCF1477671.1 DsbA family protein [Agrobacterium vitis]MUZ98669.1 thioredoxin domain-containing protein [Agrobacterium vitis]MVA30507.1 thioredoxin domain-containing protein [Agrobacterium vitis]
MIKRRTLVAAAVACLATPGLLRAKELSPQEIFFDKDIPVLGNPKGDVTIAEFFDYQCGYCKTYHPIVSKVVKDDGHVRLVMKDWPVFGPASVFAAQAVLAIANLGQYQAAQDALLDLKGGLTQDSVSQALESVGVNMTAVKAAANKNSDKISRLLDRNWLQAQALNFQGTPSFVIGTTLYPGALDEKALKEAIAKARAA